VSARGKFPHQRMALFAAALLAVGGVQAQDSFGEASAPPQPYQSPPQPYPQQQPSQPYVQTTAQPGDAAEAADFGVMPTDQLRPTEQLHAPTPTSIPGGRIIATRQLMQLLQGGQSGLMLLHAFPSPLHLPGAIAVIPAGQGGSFDDAVQREFGQYLQQATGGDTSRMLVFYCQGVQCWASYNASLRAIRLGYRNVHWYRGGLDAWQQAGLPIQDGSQPSVQSPVPQQQGRQ